MAAITEVTKEVVIKQNPDFEFSEERMMQYDRLLVISVGTGSSKIEKKYSAGGAAKWGIIGWLFEDGHNPLIDAYNQVV